jgi:MFS family permease
MTSISAETAHPEDTLAPPSQGTAAQGWIVIATTWLAVAAAAVVAPVAPEMADHFSATPGAEGLVQLGIGLPALFAALLAGPFGLLADRVGRRSVLLAALVVYSACGMAPLVLESLPQILLSRAGVGAAEAAVLATATALIGDYFKGSEREKWFAIQGGTATIVAFVLIAISGVLGETGWRSAFGIYLAPLILFAFVVRFLPEPSRAARTSEETLLTSPLWRRIVEVGAVSFLAAIAFYVVLIQLPFLLADRGFAEPRYAAIGVAAGAISAPVGALLFRRLGGRPVAGKLSLSFAFSTLGLLVIFATRDFRLTLLGAAINGLGSGVALPTLMTWAMTGLKPRERGRAAGFWNASFFLGQFVSPLAFLAVVTGVGGRTSAFAIFAALTATGAIVAAVLAVAGRRGRTRDLSQKQI